jgi:hypothetical protein
VSSKKINMIIFKIVLVILFLRKDLGIEGDEGKLKHDSHIL